MPGAGTQSARPAPTAKCEPHLRARVGDWHTRQTRSDAGADTPQQNPIAFYQKRRSNCHAASQQDERLPLTLTTAATKLSQSLADKQTLPEATAALQQAIVQQQQLLQMLPESDRFQLNLLSLLDRLCHLAKARQDIAGEVAAAEAFLNKAEALYQSDPPLYSRAAARLCFGFPCAP